MRLAFGCLVCALLSVSLAAAAGLSGRVSDSSGAAVPGAIVRVEGPVTREATSGSDGAFGLPDLPDGDYAVQVTLAGFADWRDRIRLGSEPTPLLVTLVPRTVTDTLVVTASRGSARASDPAAPVSVVSGGALATAPSPVLDDVLRMTPGFSLFRRTSSRTANPTTQGATLRGLAASGASRALVLADGLVLNDPFGGWVYWNRIPEAAVDRVEVVRGAASDLYGADALGGVVQVLTTDPSAARPAARLVLGGDSHATVRSSAFAAVTRGAWSAAMSGEASRTDGTYVIDAGTRGPVDRRAGADYLTGRVSVGVTGRGWRTRLHALAYGESRDNGTELQLNDTSLRQLAADVAGPLGPGFVDASGSAGDQTYHQTFSAVAAGRSSETLTSRQTVPTTFVRGSLTYRVPIARADLLAGYDSREAWATNVDQSFLPDGRVRGLTTTPGYDHTQGLFTQIRTPLGARASLTAGVRNDWWYRTPDSSDPVSVASPRLAVSFRLSPLVALRGSVSRAFRAPTPNERIRPFRVGSVVTLANPDLEPERLTMGEAGVFVEGGRGSLRATVFGSRVRDAVTNVTLSSTPQLVTRQRRNAAEVRAAGIEGEGDWRLAPSLWLTGALAVTASTYRDTPGLSGNTVPQVPRWQSALGARWQGPSGLALRGFLRSVSGQYEDDRNTLELRPATLVDLSLSRPFGPRVSIVGAVENLFDVEYDTGRTPTRTIGTPLTARLAFRIAY